MDVLYNMCLWEHSGSVVECLALDLGTPDTSLIGVTALGP